MQYGTSSLKRLSTFWNIEQRYLAQDKYLIVFKCRIIFDQRESQLCPQLGQSVKENEGRQTPEAVFHASRSV